MPGSPIRKTQSSAIGSVPAGTFPLALSANSRFLQTAGGAPFLMNSSSAWGLIPGLSLANAKAYIDARAAQGFNVLLSCLVVANNTIPPGNETWINTVDAFTTPGDYSTFNPTYFAHADDVLDYAESKGVFLWINPLYLGWYGSGGSGSWDLVAADNPAHLTAYGTFLGNRYKNRKGIGWLCGGDQYPEWAAFAAFSSRAAITAGEHALFDAIKAVANTQFYTGHMGTDTDQPTFYGMHSYDAVEYRTYYAAPWGVAGHYAFSETNLARPLIYTRDREYHNGFDQFGNAVPTMPHCHIDESYEGEPNGTPVEMRRRQHRGMTEGCCGGAFNAGPSWYTNFNTTTGSTGQTENVYWWQFWSSIAWWSLTPDVSNTFVTAGRGTYTTNTYICATASSVLLVAYFPDTAAATITVAMSQFSKTMRARWWDPTANTFTLISSSLANSGTQNFVQPGNNSSGSTTDWLLILD